MIGVFYAIPASPGGCWRTVSVSCKKNHAYWDQWCLASVEKGSCLPHSIIWRDKKRFWGETKECPEALLISHLVAYREYNNGKKHWKIVEPQAFINTDKGWAEMHLKDLNICRNLKYRKQNCSLRKQESERKRHLAQPVAKGCSSDSCETGKWGSEQVACKTRAQLSGRARRNPHLTV